MNPAIPKDAARKIHKFVEAADALRSGKETYFSITKLTSIKRLCEAPRTAAHFVLFLAERTLEKADSKPCPSHLDTKDWEGLKELMAESVHAMRTHLEQATEKTLAALSNLLARARTVQSFSGRQVWGRAIRTINSWDVLIIEDALQCILNPHAAPELAYEAAKDYTEKYNPRYGAGLIPESVPMLEDIIQFWKNLIAAETESVHAQAQVSGSRKKPKKRGTKFLKAKETQYLRMVKVVATGSFEDKYPKLSSWIENRGWLEIGYTEMSRSFIRVLDEGGMVWERKAEYQTIDDALEDAERGIQRWLGEDH